MDEDTTEIMEEKLQDMVNSYRDELDVSENLEESEEIYPIYDFTPPVQLELFWLNDPMDYQILVRTSDENREDGEIIINGPYSGSEFIENIDSILEQPRWQQPVENDQFVSDLVSHKDIIKRRDVFKDVVERFVDTTTRRIYEEKSPELSIGQTLEGSDWCYLIHGSVSEIDVDEFLEQVSMFMDIDGDLEEYNNDREQEEGYGTYIYQPVWINGPPERDLKNEVLQTHRSRELIVSTEFKSHSIHIYRDGFIVVTDVDIEDATEIINTIFGTGLFSEYSWEAVQQNELVSVKVYPDEEDHYPYSQGSLSMPRNLLRTQKTRDLPITFNRKVISDTEILEIIDESEDVFDNSDLREKMIFALQAYTHLSNNEYSQAFLLSWISIEQHMNQLLESHLDSEENMSNNRIGDITDSPNWYASQKIELLEITGALSKEEYDKINDMRKKRNDIVHDMYTASESEAQNVTKLSLELIQDELPIDFGTGLSLP